jgi:hypothetical protein
MPLERRQSYFPTRRTCFETRAALSRCEIEAGIGRGGLI